MSISSTVDQEKMQHRHLGQQICAAIQEEIKNTGFIEDDINGIPEFDQADFSLKKDPFTAQENLTGYWYDERKRRIGNIQFLSDGSFYAEYDVVKPHPTKKQWFVEAIIAWGKEGLIKTEAKLLPSLQ